MLFLVPTSCKSLGKKENKETTKYIIPDVYIPAVPEFKIEPVIFKDTKGVFISDPEWLIVLKYMMECEEAAQVLYNYNSVENKSIEPP